MAQPPTTLHLQHALDGNAHKDIVKIQ